MTRRKRDGRRNNGRKPTGLSEVRVHVKVSRALSAAVAARAVADGVTVSDVWRLAAAAYVGLVGQQVVDIAEETGKEK